MAHPINLHRLQRANKALMLGAIWAALATCAIGAIVYDLSHWLIP
jgi:hypothetical protein